MSSPDESFDPVGGIRRRLAAVEDIDWSRVERGYDEEHYGDWLHIGPVHLMTSFSPGQEDLADVVQTQAVAEFLEHAARDIRVLLAERDATVTDHSTFVAMLTPGEREKVEALMSMAKILNDNERGIAALKESMDQSERQLRRLKQQADESNGERSDG